MHARCYVRAPLKPKLIPFLYLHISVKEKGKLLLFSAIFLALSLCICSYVAIFVEDEISTAVLMVVGG